MQCYEGSEYYKGLNSWIRVPRVPLKGSEVYNGHQKGSIKGTLSNMGGGEAFRILMGFWGPVAYGYNIRNPQNSIVSC